MITVFVNFSRKTGVFLKNKCYGPIFAQSSSSLGKKTPTFLPNFSAKIIGQIFRRKYFKILHKMCPSWHNFREIKVFAAFFDASAFLVGRIQ
jgi:hypothetical protein